MKFSISRLGIIALATTVGMVINSRSANAASFSFSQTGWANGGIVTGTFSGQDTNNDGKISSVDGEVSAYGMTFSGNTNIPPSIPPFSHDLTDLVALIYNLLDNEMEFIISSTLAAGFGYNGNTNIFPNIGRINNDSGGLTTTTSMIVQLTSIPEGNSLIGLTAVTLMGGLTLGRRSQRTDD